MEQTPKGNLIDDQLHAVYVKMRNDAIMFIAMLVFFGFCIIFSIIHWALENSLI